MNDQPVALVTTFRERAFLKLEEAATMLGISVGKFEELVDAGRLCQPHRFGPKTRRWRVDDLLKSADRMQGDPLT